MIWDVRVRVGLTRAAHRIPDEIAYDYRRYQYYYGSEDEFCLLTDHSANENMNTVAEDKQRGDKADTVNK